MDLSFPSQQTTTATSCIPYNSLYMPGPPARKSENGFFSLWYLTPNIPTWLQNLWSRSHTNSTHRKKLQTLKTCRSEICTKYNQVFVKCKEPHVQLYLIDSFSSKQNIQTVFRFSFQVRLEGCHVNIRENNELQSSAHTYRFPEWNSLLWVYQSGAEDAEVFGWKN